MTKLLIVDDNEQNLYMLRVLLESHGYEVVTATNGAEALEKARSDPPDVIISDILMPVMDGFTLCRQWKKDERLKGIPFVFYTATYTDPQDEEFALSLGAERFIVKPVEPDVFVEMLREVIREAEEGRLVAPREPIEEEPVYLKQYSERLVRKLEKKVLDLEGEITECKQAEEALREYQEMFSAFMEQLPAVAFIKDENSRLQYANPYMRDTLGANAWLSKIATEHYPRDLAEQLIANDRKALAEGPLVKEDCVPDKRGDKRYFQTHKFPIRHQDKRPLLGCIAIDITERKRAEEALQESEEKYRLLVENATVTIVVAQDGMLKFFNPKAMEITGYSQEELASQPFTELIHPDDLEVTIGYYLKFLQGEETPPFHTFRIIDKEGSIKWLESNAVLITWEDSPATLNFLSDITERKQAEDALWESRNMLQTVLDSIPSTVFWKDRDSIYLGANRALLEMAGWKSSEEVVGKNDYDLPWGKEQADSFREDDKRVMESGIPEYGIIEPHLRTNGTLAWAMTNKVPLRDTEGNIVGVLGTSADITERKRAEEALRESEQNFKDLAENSPDGIIIADANGVHLYANRRAAEITGYSVDELVGMTGWDLTRQEDVNKFKQGMKKRMADEPHVGKYERFFVRKDGTEVLTEMSTTTTMWQGKKRPLAIIRDITERKRAEEARAHGQRTLLALSQAAQAVQRAHTPEEVYCTIGDEVSRLGYNAVIFILTDDREHLALRHLTFEPTLVQRIGKLTGLSAQDFRFPLRPDGCFQRVITEGEAIFRESSLELMIEALPQPLHPLVGRLTAMLGTEQGIVTPLAIGGEAHGVLAVTGAGLTEADVPAVTAFANQGAIAIENARLYDAEHAARQQLRDLTNYLQTAREEERTYIAREIHDEFGQALTALKMDLSWLTKRLPADKPGLAEKASVMWGLIDDTIQTVRRVAARLRPGLLDDLGLAAAIEWQVGEFAERTEIDCQLYMSDEEIALDHDLATAVFRILQETLTNIARHAQATEVRVELEVRPDELVLAMCDNGKGITEGEVSDPRSLGLIGMRERARSWGGDVTFEGVPGQGTTVTVRIPNAEFGMRNAESFR